MATKISTELLITILNNVQSTRDLYSSLLVNRIWCKVTIPILWELPFGQECHTNDDRYIYTKLRKKSLCIRTFISCMDTQARTLLIQNGFNLSSSPPQATFDYPSFTHKLLINNLIYFIFIYSQRIIGSNRDNKNDNNNETRILFREMCKLILKFADSFKMTKVLNYISNSENYLKYIDSFFKLPDSSKKLNRKERLIKPLTLICNNILNMELYLDSISQMELLTKLISVQKWLENLSIVSNNYLNCDLIFWNVISQKKKLKSLRLESVSFYAFKGKSSSIGQFISELYIKDCCGLHESDCLFFASSFTQLRSFQYFHKFYLTPQEFIIKLLETANTNLKNICLDVYLTITSDIFSAILNYCTAVTRLTLLQTLTFEQVIAIFNNNFHELSKFSFNYEGNANELLWQMAENVPESLETIEIRMGIFNVDSLRNFFKGWWWKGEGRNKKIIVNYRTLSDEYFKVIKEYGMEFKLLEE